MFYAFKQYRESSKAAYVCLLRNTEISSYKNYVNYVVNKTVNCLCVGFCVLCVKLCEAPQEPL